MPGTDVDQVLKDLARAAKRLKRARKKLKEAENKYREANEKAWGLVGVALESPNPQNTAAAKRAIGSQDTSRGEIEKWQKEVFEAEQELSEALAAFVLLLWGV